MTADADTNPTEPEPTEPEEDQPEESGETPATGHDRLPDDHPVVKALNKANDEAKQYRLKVKEFEDRDKTEAQRLAEAKDQAAQEATEAKAEATRLRMAIKYGLDEEDLDLLGSGDEEQIESRAKRLAERIVRQEPAANERVPREALKPGATPDSSPDQNDMNALLRAAVRGE